MRRFYRTANKSPIGVDGGIEGVYHPPMLTVTHMEKTMKTHYKPWTDGDHALCGRDMRGSLLHKTKVTLPSNHRAREGHVRGMRADDSQSE